MANELDALQSNLQNYLVSPLNAFGLGGFVFDVEGEATTTLTAEITDHYTEDNKATQDHIARRPKMITLKGYVGEVVYQPNPDPISGIIGQVTQKLTQLSAFLPTVSTALSQAQAAVTDGSISFSNAVGDASDIYSLVKNSLSSISGDTPKQQQAYCYFKACWEQGVLMGIQTPWEFLTNMAIESVTAIQPEGSKYITDFSVRYKQMRFAKTSTVAYNGSAQTSADNAEANAAIIGSAQTTPVETQNLDGTPVLQGDAAAQSQNALSIGNVPGVSLPSSLLSGAQAQLSSAVDMLKNSGVAKIFEYAVKP